MSSWMEDYDAELVAKAKAEVAAEDAAFAALPQVERDRLNAEREAKAAALFDALNNGVDPLNEDDENDEDDEDE